jgi:hypothetical protein
MYTTFLDKEEAFDGVPREHLRAAVKDGRKYGTLLWKIQCLFKILKGIVRIGGVKSEECGCVNRKKRRQSEPLIFITFVEQIIKQDKSRTGKKRILYWNKRPT